MPRLPLVSSLRAVHPPRTAPFARSLTTRSQTQSRQTALLQSHSHSRPQSRSYPLSHTSPPHQTLRALYQFPSTRFSDRYPVISAVVRLGLSAVIGVTLVVGVILVHDAFTYSERHVERVPTNPLGLHPRRGGKKNLPILEADLDEESDEVKAGPRKPRLVIVGGGWGVSRFVKWTNQAGWKRRETLSTELTSFTGGRNHPISSPRHVQCHPHLASDVFRIHPSPPLGMCRYSRSSVARRTAAQARGARERALFNGKRGRSGYE